MNAVHNERALEWMQFLPQGASYSLEGDAPPWFGVLLDSVACVNARGGRIAVSWGVAPTSPSPDSSVHGLVAFNAPVDEQSLRATGFSYVRRYAILPSMRDPRWFIPLDTPRVASAGFDIYSPYQPKARMKHAAARLLSRAGMHVWYRDHVCIALRELPQIERALGSLELGDSRLAISTGTPGPGRKCTAFVLNRQGVSRAVAKIASSPASERLLRHEAEMLRSIRPRVAEQTSIPEVLLNESIEGRFLTVQTVVPGRRSPRHLTAAHHRLLTDLSSGAAKPVTSTRLFDQLPARALALEPARPDLATAWSNAADLLNGTYIPQTIVHGDFTPWNLKVHGDEVLAFDWEFGEIDGVPLFDELHHRLQVGALLNHWSIERARDELRSIASMSPNFRPSEVYGLQLVYLLNVLIRRLEMGFAPTDAFVIRYEALIKMLTASTEMAPPA